MLPTEVQRILLLIGLAATGYLMILAWNDDYVKQAPESSYSAEPELPMAASELPQDVPAGGDVAAPPGDQSSAAIAHDDVPDPSLLSAAPAPPVAPASTPAAAERLVRVSTPTLRVWIDLLGGDIVRVQLPKYPQSLDTPDVPYLLLDNGRDRTYIAQSGLIGSAGIDSGGSRPLFHAPSAELDVAPGERLELVLHSERNGMALRKIYSFDADDYLIGLRYELDNEGSEAVNAGLFAQIKRDGKAPPGESAASVGPKPYLGAAITTQENRYQKIKLDDLDDAPFRETVEGGWIAFLQHYFLSAWIGNPEDSNRYYGQSRSDGTYIVGYTSPSQTIAPGATGVWESRFYAGPKDQKQLEQIAPNLNLTVDYGFLWWIAVPLFYILDWLHGFVGNWGVAIILLTLGVKLVLYPLSAASYRSMANMRRVAPQMKRLQERYADDRQKLSQEMMNLYKKEGVNPLGGCLPMLLPMPIFIALYWVLFESVELRHAPFMLWIHDLAAMDPYFVLPLAMGGSMYLQQLLSPQVGDPMQVRMMKLMPIVFTALFLFFPAGLVLYWLVNSLLSIAQQWYVMRQTNAQPAKS
ncbi:MAG: membrane protein insertase YidC [Pseudomonadales bacterium]